MSDESCDGSCAFCQERDVLNVGRLRVGYARQFRIWHWDGGLFGRMVGLGWLRVRYPGSRRWPWRQP
jgi:hypothetical protein